MRSSWGSRVFEFAANEVQRTSFTVWPPEADFIWRGGFYKLLTQPGSGLLGFRV